MNLLLVLLAAHADTETVLSYADVGFEPARLEQLASGPDHIAAGPDGLIAMFDPVNLRIIVIRKQMELRSFSAPFVDDVAFTPEGHLVLLEGRSRVVSLWSQDGVHLDQRPLPGLVPAGIRLSVDGDEIYAKDIFGNRHPVAAVDGQQFIDSEGPRLLPPIHTVKWMGWGFEVDDVRIPLPPVINEAAHAGAQVVGDHWLLIDAVMKENPIAVTRVALHLETGKIQSLPVDNRHYVPQQDVDAWGGVLFYLDPQADGLHLHEVGR